VFRRLDQVMKSGRQFLASNTSTLDVNKIADFTRRPSGRGRHALLQVPANVMKLLEGGARARRPPRTSSRTVMGPLAKKIKKTAVVSGVCGTAFIGKPHGSRQYLPPGPCFLLEEGATPSQGGPRRWKAGALAMGPFPHVADLAGNDIGWGHSANPQRPLPRAAQLSSTTRKIADRAVRTGSLRARRRGWAGTATKAGRRDAVSGPRRRADGSSTTRKEIRSAAPARSARDENRASADLCAGQ